MSRRRANQTSRKSAARAAARRAVRWEQRVLISLRESLNRSAARARSGFGRQVARLKAVERRMDAALFAALHRVGNAIERAAIAAAMAPVRAGRAVYRAGIRGAHTVATGIADLFIQIGHDITSLARGVLDAVRTVALAVVEALRASVRAVAKIVAVPLRPLTTPIRAIFARRAREELLGEATVTPDKHSHKELLLLLGATGVLLSALLLWVTQSGGGVGRAAISTVSVQLSPKLILERLAEFSPSQLMVVFAGLALLLAALWFWLKMVRDAFTRTFDSNTERTKWRTTVVLFGILGGAVYFMKVYNQWSLRRFVGYHFLTVMVTGVAFLVATSTYGTLWYFNKKAEAQASQAAQAKLPNLQVDEKTKAALLGRTQYGAPLTLTPGGRPDPFAPIPGQETTEPAPSASPSPSPSPSPTPAPDNQ